MKGKEKLPPNIKWHKLERADLAEEFRNAVVDKMVEMGDMNERSVNECWSEMAMTIRMTARRILGESKGIANLLIFEVFLSYIYLIHAAGVTPPLCQIHQRAAAAKFWGGAHV